MPLASSGRRLFKRTTVPGTSSSRVAPSGPLPSLIAFWLQHSGSESFPTEPAEVEHVSVSPDLEGMVTTGLLMLWPLALLFGGAGRILSRGRADLYSQCLLSVGLCLSIAFLLFPLLLVLLWQHAHLPSLAVGGLLIGLLLGLVRFLSLRIDEPVRIGR